MNPVNIAAIAERILKEVIDELGDVWRDLNDDDRECVRKATQLASELAVRELQSAMDAGAKAALERNRAHVEAQLANIKSAAAMRVKSALLAAVTRLVLSSAVTLRADGT